MDKTYPNIDSMNDAKKVSQSTLFFQKHCTLRTYFFQVNKCNDLECLHHKPLHGGSQIDVFLDPVPSEVEGVLHYQLESNPWEKNLLSILEGVEESSHNIPFSPAA